MAKVFIPHLDRYATAKPKELEADIPDVISSGTYHEVTFDDGFVTAIATELLVFEEE